jgi:stage II sporulation protein D
LLLAVVTAAAACAAPAARAPVRRAAGEPDIRVALLTGASSVRIGGQGRVAGVVGGRTVFRMGAGESVQAVPEGTGVRLSGGSVAGRYDDLFFTSLDGGRFVTVNGKPYRGEVELLGGSGGLRVVNEVGVEAYLGGVVNAEMGRREASERAALEAQAIVARTYALKNLGRFASSGYDLRASASDQVYGGVEAETEVGVAAVRATAGEVVMYRGELVTTFFHSTCGYSTAAPEEAFRWGVQLDYLRPVSDRHGGGHYCDASPRFRWTVEWDGAMLLRILRETVPAVLGVDAGVLDELHDVRVHRTGPSGRVAEIRIGVSRGEIPVFAPDIRRVFETPGGNLLGSSAVQLAVEKAGGRVQRVTASGAGWGHGVGLCQWGAIGRARAGQDARTIVTTYFPGSRIERRY